MRNKGIRKSAFQIPAPRLSSPSLRRGEFANDIEGMLARILSSELKNRSSISASNSPSRTFYRDYSAYK
jgi:hypothetical protein